MRGTYIARSAIGPEGRATIRAIGERIRQQRERCGWKRADLGARLGRNRSGQVGDWEAGRVAPGALALIRLSQALGCTVDWLLKGNEGLPGPVATEEETP